jgi:hemerythrin
MTVLWRSEMSVGNADMDGDHRQLIAALNEFDLLAKRLPDDRALRAALIELRDLAIFHFRREEAIQIVCGYPFHAEHAKCHMDLVSDISAKAQCFFVDRTEPVTKATLSETVDFLRHWLLDHMVRFDRPMREFMGNLPASFRLPE